jgi:regulation of enolase protein 1 (concanavalin A-like superfamily)
MLRWLGTPGIDAVEQDGTIEFGAGPISDWFVDPRTGSTTSSAPGALVETGPAPFTVSCGVDAELAATFDAVAMFVHYDDTHWLKFAVELSSDGRIRLVTVRTAGASDDCNHEVVTGARCWLRATVDERSIAVHARTSPDGVWDLIRYCPAPGTGIPTVALMVQSPTGDGLRGRFDGIHVERTAVESLRDGG